MQKNMFPGSGDFRKVLEKKDVRKTELDRFFTRLENAFCDISLDYQKSVFTRNAQAGIPAGTTSEAVERLRLALMATKSKPFSEVVSPFVDIISGEPSETGKMLVMDPATAEAINSPSSRIVRIMESVPGLTFQDMSASSYEAFNYSRSGIAVGQPLLWLPLGNSLFLTRLAEFLKASTHNATVLNLGAGPGALEQLIQKNLPGFANRITVISVEVDGANLNSLRTLNSNVSYNHQIIEGDFVAPGTKARISGALSDGSALFCISGYSLHHISPSETQGMIDWIKGIAKLRHFIQVHDVIGGANGGGQSPVNRLFFNFMTCYHLLVFQPDSFYAQNGFSMMPAEDARRLVMDNPGLFIGGTSAENAGRMLENGSVAVFTIEHL